jgi:hypothetical protein
MLQGVVNSTDRTLDVEGRWTRPVVLLLESSCWRVLHCRQLQLLLFARQNTAPAGERLYST